MTTLSTLQAALAASNAAVVTAVGRKVPTAALADNSLTLNGQTATQMLAAATATTAAHANRTDNPHGTTAAQLGVYSNTAVDALVASLLPSGIVPLSRFGSNDDVALPVTASAGSLLVNFNAIIPVIIAGQFFNMPVGTLPLTNNATTYLYLRLVAGVCQYVSQLAPTTESMTNMFLGAVTMSNGVITLNTIAKVTRLDTFRVSTTAKGSAIPVSTGLPSSTGSLAWS